jgi:hypothetical protein
MAGLASRSYASAFSLPERPTQTTPVLTVHY